MVRLMEMSGTEDVVTIPGPEYLPQLCEETMMLHQRIATCNDPRRGIGSPSDASPQESPSRHARRFRMILASLGLLASLAVGGRAEADSLFVGMTYPTDAPIAFTLNSTSYNEPGGNIQGSVLNGASLPYVYCIAADVNVYVNNTYNTTVSTTGYYDGNLIRNAGQIAWLMDHEAASATTDVLRSGLQAAIWHQVYGANFVLDTTNTNSAIVSAYNADIAALGSNTDPVSNLFWMTPYDSGGNAEQGLITIASVPEPSSLLLLGCGGLGLIIYLRRKQGKVVVAV